jgi:GntR family transcriptional regulator/MocR family aminotransferase
MDVHVSLVGRENLSSEIYRQLRAAIVDGRLRPGDSLPPSREMARTLGVARTTVTVAYERLAGEGFIGSRVGSGTFVNVHAARVPPPRRERRESALEPREFWQSFQLGRVFARKAEFDFRSGLPDASLFPHDLWRRLMTSALREEQASSGVYDAPAGHRELREAIARHIGVARAVQCTAQDVTITNGTQQALDVIARVLLSPRDRVAVEDPGYPPPRRLFESLGARVAGVPVDEEGLIVDAIPKRTKLVYVTPSHQYPLGVSMTFPRRLALLAWAERNDAAIVEDDYDSEFRFGGRPIEPLQTLDSTGRVIYVGSFSKTTLPTLRLGFIVTPPSLTAAAEKAKFLTDWHTSLPVQAAMARFIESGAFARHIRKVGAVYRRRHALVTRGLTTQLGDYLDVVPSAAGLHVTAVARRINAARMDSIVDDAFVHGVAVQSLARFGIGKRPRVGIVLGYGSIPTERIDEGLRRLKTTLCRYLDLRQ